MKFVYFSIPQQVINNALPDDPKRIWELAMLYRNKKAQVDALRDKYLGSPDSDWISKLDNTVQDIGGASGLGLTILGAKLKQYDTTRGIGTGLKKHGVNTLLDKDLKALYGIGVPTTLVAGTGLLAKQGYDSLINNDYD